MNRPQPGRIAQPVFPFFVGCGRSGTTLLRAMFDSHPQVFIPDEVSFVVRLSSPRNRWRYQRGNSFDRAALLHLLRRNNSFRRWGLPESFLRDLEADESLLSFSDVMRSVYGAQAIRYNKSKYGDKTPMHVLHMPQLLRLFPEARFVHIIRDGRDVASSYMSIKEWGPNTLEQAALDWRRRLTIGRRDGRVIGPRSYMEIRYEDLVVDPATVVREVCQFLELDFDEVMLRYHERAQSVIGDVRFPVRHQHLRLPPTPQLRDWRRDMPSEAVTKFELLAGGVLAELGYERTMPETWSPRQRLYRLGLRAFSGAARLSNGLKAAYRGIAYVAAEGLRQRRTRS
ncbi:MAG: sulfotransferase [Acidimicrobiia bacterium]